MQFRGNPFLVPVSRIARPNPFKPLPPMQAATPGLMRPNPHRRKRSNPFVLPKMPKMGHFSIVLGTAGAVAIDEVARRWSSPVWTRGAACALSTMLGNSPMASAFGGAMFYSLFSDFYYRSVAKGIVAGASDALNA